MLDIGKMCENKNCDFEDLTDEDLQSIDSRVTKMSFWAISASRTVWMHGYPSAELLRLRCVVRSKSAEKAEQSGEIVNYEDCFGTDAYPLGR